MRLNKKLYEELKLKISQISIFEFWWKFLIFDSVNLIYLFYNFWDSTQEENSGLFQSVDTRILNP